MESMEIDNIEVDFSLSPGEIYFNDSPWEFWIKFLAVPPDGLVNMLLWDLYWLPSILQIPDLSNKLPLLQKGHIQGLRTPQTGIPLINKNKFA